MTTPSPERDKALDAALAQIERRLHDVAERHLDHGHRMLAPEAIPYEFEQADSGTPTVAADPDGELAGLYKAMARQVGREIHKMHAFVRFREVADAAAAGGRRHVAWFEPAHHVLRAVAPFFVRRFAQHPIRHFRFHARMTDANA